MSIRISEENLAAIHRKAEQADMTFTDYVTKACLGKQIVVIDGLDDVLRQQKAIGRNLNQLTMLCNMGRVSVASLAGMKEQYAEISAALTELLERKRWSDGNGYREEFGSFIFCCNKIGSRHPKHFLSGPNRHRTVSAGVILYEL